MTAPLAIVDIEARSWCEYRTGAFVTEHGDAETHDHLPSLARRIEQHPGVAGSHRGGVYDWAFLGPLDRLRENANGGGVASARYGRARLWDTYSLLPTSVAKIGEAVGLRKFPDRSTRIGELPMRKVREHAIRDAQIVLRGVLQHREAMRSLPGASERVPTTAGGTALRVLEALEPEAAAELGRHTLTADEWREHRFAFSGDRSEVFWLGARPRVYAYDINSSFPFSWLEAPVPVGPWRRVDAEDPTAPWAVYWCDRIRQNRRHLPVVEAGGQWRHDGAGYVTSEELAAIRQTGGSARVVYGWTSGQVLPLGRRAVAWLYERKLQGVPWAKGALVALHGKTIQDIVGESWVRTPTGYRAERVLTWPQWFQHPLLGLALYSRARLRLWRVLEALRGAGWEIYFAKADSVHTDCPPQKFPGRIGLACGEFKLEADRAEGIYCGHSLYGLRTSDGKTKIASTGIAPEALSWQQLEQVAAGRSVTVEHRGGLEGWRTRPLSVGPRAAVRRVTLSAHTGGKVGKRGALQYPGAGAA